MYVHLVADDLRLYNYRNCISSRKKLGTVYESINLGYTNPDIVNA